MRLSRQIILPLLAVGGLVAAACGDDDAAPFGASADTSAPADTDVPVETEAPVTAEAPVETEAPAATEAPADAAVGDGSEFCDFVERSERFDNLLDGLAGDPVVVEEIINDLGELMDEFQAVVPSEIADDADDYIGGLSMLLEAFEDADYNLLDADLSFFEDGNLDQMMTEVSGRIDEFSQERCGRSLGADTEGPSTSDPVDDSDDSDFDLSDGSIREQLVAQFVSIGFTTAEAECIANNIDPSAPGILEGDPAEVLAIFELCDISLTRLAELGG